MKKLNSYIKNCLTSLLLIVGIFTGMQHAQAQQYPVQGFLSIIPPYPAQLADYANPNINRLNLTLTLNDISVNNKRVRLKVFVLRQNSLFTQTSGNYFGDMPVILTSGIPEQLTSNELAGYFKLQNLQGIVPDSYAQPLGEGFMNIYFVVYDYFTGRQLSNKIEFPFFILLNDPPLLNLPLNGAHISNAGAIAPQIAFSWTSRATQASNTDYVFTLAPIYDPSGDPFTQFLASIPVYQTTISNQTNLLYGFAEPPLLPGKTYGWRIQAKAKSGFEDVGLYKQNGFSEIHTFTYDNPCLPIADQDVTVEARASDRLYLQWQPPTDAGQQLSGGYMVAYRKYSAGGMWNWQEQTTQTPNYYITGLEPTTDYEVKVARTCTDGTYTYTNPQKATTLAVNQLPVKIDCGKIPSIDISNQNPLLQLNSGDVVMAGDFPVTILRANNVAGRFSGEGWVKVPYLADTKIHVTYQNIKVNTDYKLIDGYFETVYNAKDGNIVSVDTALADVGALLKQVKYLLGDVKNWISDTTKTAQNIAIINKYVDSIKAKTPTLADSSVNATHDDLDSLQNISKTISTTTDDGTKNNLIAQAVQVAKDAQDLMERATNGVSLTHVLDNFADDNKTLNFLTITGKKITIPKLNRYTEVRFAYGIKDNTTIKDPICYLYSFKITPDKKDDGTPNAIEYVSKVDNNGNFLGYFTNDGVLFDNQLTISNTANNVILMAPRKDGLYIIKISANIEPYKNNDPFVNYDNFSQKIITANVIQRTNALPYSDMGKYIEYINDDYGLVQDFITKATEGHENDPEYFYTLKIAELHTAYRGLFDKFTDPDCYEKWSSDLYKTIPGGVDPVTGSSSSVPVLCNGVWEQTMLKDNSILSLLSSDPVAYYRRFITDLIAYIDNQALVKNNFLDNLSLTTSQADASDFLINSSNDEISKIDSAKRDILLRVLGRNALSDQVGQSVIRLVQNLPASDEYSLLTVLLKNKDADNKAFLNFLDPTFWPNQNIDEYNQFTIIISHYASVNGYTYGSTPADIFAYFKSIHDQFAVSQQVTKPVVINDVGGILAMIRKAHLDPSNKILNHDFLVNNIKFDSPGNFTFTQETVHLNQATLTGIKVVYNNPIYPNNDQLDCTNFITNTTVDPITQMPNNAVNVGDNITIYLQTKDAVQQLLAYFDTPIGNTIALFVNGYRRADWAHIKDVVFEKPDTKNTILTQDQVDDGEPYWDGIDRQFITKLNSKNVYYADGHMSIKTSNHLSLDRFFCSIKSCYPVANWALLVFFPKIYLSTPRCLEYLLPTLNTTPNPDGFNQRRQQGKIGGQNLLTQLLANSTVNKNGQIITDTLDIICHSMGYAYAMGMVDALKGHVPFGRMYIVAPEDAGASGTDWSQFTEVWQYGSDPTQDGVLKQDGVAPQVGAANLLANKRAYIPDQSNGVPVPKNFLDCHKIDNYWWIFNLQNQQRGYVTQRK